MKNTLWVLTQFPNCFGDFLLMRGQISSIQRPRIKKISNVRKLCFTHNVLLVLDEVATSKGRLGHMAERTFQSSKQILRSIDFTDSFSFLDVGCGNGWVVRAMAEHAKCAHSLGIDVSAGMIKTAKSKSISKKKRHICIQTLNHTKEIRLITYFQWNHFTMLNP